MYKALVFFSIFLATHYQLSAQIYPKENSKLNYRLIGFSYPPLPEVSNYTIQIAEGNYNTDDSFEKNIINTINTQKNKVIIEVPSFGKEYTWRSITGTTTSAKKHTQLHHFSTTMSPAVDTNLTRLRILEKAEKYKDAYVFIDGTNVMYDMQGNPIWYMPDIEIADQGIIHSRDLKLTPQGTITLLWKKAQVATTRLRELGKICQPLVSPPAAAYFSSIVDERKAARELKEKTETDLARALWRVGFLNCEPYGAVRTLYSWDEMPRNPVTKKVQIASILSPHASFNYDVPQELR